MKEKYLDGAGNGEFVYDLEDDLLMFKVKDRNYKLSVEQDNFVFDIDEEGFVTGLRIFDASLVFGVTKNELSLIGDWEFKAVIHDNILNLSLKFNNKKEKFNQYVSIPADINISDSIVECVA